MGPEVCNLRAARNIITLIELKGVFKHFLAKPHAGESVEQALVKVVGDTTTILDLTKHVMYCDPRHTLGGGGKDKNIMILIVKLLKKKKKERKAGMVLLIFRFHSKTVLGTTKEYVQSKSIHTHTCSV